MCGIAGIFGPNSRNSIDAVTDCLAHRGPDGRGIWTSESGLVSLGHRRLSIIDTSNGGHQPMVSQDGKFVIVFNGEIYNFQTLRAKLSDVSFRSTSDTEVLVEMVARFGFRETLDQLNGMFAIAIYDIERKKMHFARDRMGEKPLYYSVIDGSFVFGSELKAIAAHPRFSGIINRNSLALYTRYNCVPAPHSIYEGVSKLPAAHFMSVTISSSGKPVPSAPTAYWDAKEIAENGLNNPLDLTDGEAVDALESRIQSTVASRMISDVPLGAFLSGGYDSTLVVAMMQQQSKSPIKTFSIGMDVSGYNEAEHAKAVASHLGTEHTELYISPDDALAVIPKLSSIYCEPFADSSQIPTYLVSKMAREHVTVALSGDGGDEFFAGYNRHFWGKRVWEKLAMVPRPLRIGLAKMATMLSADRWNKLLAILGKGTSLPGNKLHKLAGVAHSKSALSMYHKLTSNCQQPERLVKQSREPIDLITSSSSHPRSADFSELMMYLDSVTYLPEDILTKVDRASMAVSLEARVPLIDHELVECAWSLPQRFKIRDGEGKWILKQIVHRHVPEAMMRRPKMGFGVPIDKWLRGPLKSWASELLDRDRLTAEGFFEPSVVCDLFERHLSGKAQLELQLWSILMFQSWYSLQGSKG